MKNLVPVLVLSALLSGCNCNKDLASPGNLVCQVVTREKQTCSAVLTLESGVIRFNQKDHSFELKAHYNACYQVDDVKISGEFKYHPYESVFDLELLAKKVVGKNTHSEQFPRTIGLVTLSNTTLQGRFVDIWAVIRTHTNTTNNLPQVEVNCRNEFDTRSGIQD